MDSKRMYYLKLDGVEGEGQTDGYQGWLELDHWSFGAHNNHSIGSHSSGGSGGTGQFTDISFTRHLDKASPVLQVRTASAQAISTGTLVCCKQNGEDKFEYFKLELENIVFSSYQCSGSGSGELPMESCSFGFAKIKIYYTPQNEDGGAGGTVDQGWDQTKHKPA
jgi:type VI secretion system secreted protein Hcp